LEEKLSKTDFTGCQKNSRSHRTASLSGRRLRRRALTKAIEFGFFKAVTSGVNFINILCPHFEPIFLHKKIAKTKYN